MIEFDCKLIQNLDDLEFLCDKFDPKWLDRCCANHECMLLDFTLSALLQQFGDNYKFNWLYLRLIKKMIDTIRQNQLTIDAATDDALQIKIIELINQRDEKIAFEGIEILDKYLRLHTNSCEECHSNCPQLRAIISKFLANDCLRTKIKADLMICLLKHSKEWRPTISQLTEQYNALGNPINRNQAVFFIVFLLERFPLERDVHIQLMSDAISDSTTKVFTGMIERLLPQVFKRTELRAWFLCFYNQICKNFDILSALTIALLIMENNSDLETLWDNVVEENKLLQGLLHCDSNVRIVAFRLLCHHQKQTANIRPSDLKMIQSFLFTNMTVAFPTMRNEICAAFKKFLIRIAVLVQLKYRQGIMSSDLYTDVKTFLTSVHNQTVDSLLNDANFNRRIMSLMLLELLHTSNIFNVNVQDTTLYELLELGAASRSSRLFEALLKNLEYSYDLIQSLSLNLIEKVVFEIDDNIRDEFLKDVLRNADNISSEVQHFITFQTKVIGLKFPNKLKFVLNEICSKCRQRVDNNSLNVIITSEPVHTLLNVVASLLPHISFDDSDSATYLRTNVIDLCFAVTKIVEPVLRSISPEGMLLLDEQEEDRSSDESNKHIHKLILEQRLESQTLLVGCWRTLKAISTIFAIVVKQSPDQLLLGDWNDLLPAFKDYFWTQLTVCRHRGVFELAAQSFQIVCQRYSKLFAADEDHPLNPLSWLREILIAIRGGVDVQLLCSTRRSAGLPHLIVAILRNYQPNAANKLYRNVHLDTTMALLCSCRSLENVFEIHCVNVIKALLHNTIFRKQVIQHLESVLLLTFDGLNSADWSVRNSYSQLFSVLIMRIFGSENINRARSGVTLKEFSIGFPAAYEMLLQLLSCFDSERQTTESIVQPVLALLSHVRPASLRSIEHMRSLLAYMHEIAFNATRETVRQLAVQSITAIANADALFEEHVHLYKHLIQNFCVLRSNTLTSLFQLITSIIEQLQDAGNLAKLSRAFNEVFETKFDLFSRNDFIVFHFLQAVIALTGRGCSFSFQHLFSDFKLKEGQFAVSAQPLAYFYIRFCSENKLDVDFDRLPNNFALHCLEYVLPSVQRVSSETVVDVLLVAKKQRRFSSIRRVMSLLDDRNEELLGKLTERADFCDWMNEYELLLLKLNTKRLSGGRTSDLCETIERIGYDCTPNVALKVLNLLERMTANDGGMSDCMERQMAFFLQSEDLNVRQKAASLVSSSCCRPMQNKLYSNCCWLLEVRKHPQLLAQVQQLNTQVLNSNINLASEACETRNEQRIFSPLAKNTFVEAFVLKDEMEAMTYLVHRLESTC